MTNLKKTSAREIRRASAMASTAPVSALRFRSKLFIVRTFLKPGNSSKVSTTADRADSVVEATKMSKVLTFNSLAIACSQLVEHNPVWRRSCWPIVVVLAILARTHVDGDDWDIDPPPVQLTPPCFSQKLQGPLHGLLARGEHLVEHLRETRYCALWYVRIHVEQRCEEQVGGDGNHRITAQTLLQIRASQGLQDLTQVFRIHHMKQI
eukprot:CAMPEP_0177266330 /NCGR_PEP_ID=MMETSP0367-20130122/62621_1 /TAXON_ID=447022 ORGANISM="Scrippsiella hangoei-like, Strain SHHI-4" /NCGR_SAMPLE_ID=MMETSP0367 /ASSEMBLY_ACC=CAM_ASM_000362 /LENGTH=207 /DNA_ID=CAMNT_0018721681 /DNA_START=297 /DNA_END=920 /DNA_ORIENTATION=+